MKRIEKKTFFLMLAAGLLLVLMLGIGAFAAGAGETISGSFPLVDGKDVATIRYIYQEDGEETYAFAEYTQTSSGYAYSFTAPVDGFTAVEASSLDASLSGATVIAEYYDVNRWDGAVDVSWYNEEASEFYIYTPAQFAGVAAIVNGSVDGGTPDYRIKGDQSFIANTFDAEGSLPAHGVGPLYTGLPEHDFSNRTIYLMSDLDMGGADGSAITHYGYNETSSQYDYPNWMPIGGQFLADLNDFDTMVMAFFNGTFDGCGHHITNIYCYRWKEGTKPGTTNNAFCYGQGTGVFGAIGTLYKDEDAPSVSPAIRNVSVSGYVYGRRMVGGLVGYAGGGSNSVDYGIVDQVLIENCANHIYVYNTDSKGVAGIIATAMVKGNIINCYNTGNISTNYANPAGGIVGSNEGMNIFCCYSVGQIDTQGNNRGRGIGSNGDGGADYIVNNCYYLRGSQDDSIYQGYYTANLAPSISVTVTELSASDITNGTLLGLLNVNGTAYVAGDDGSPVLCWEKTGGTSVSVSVQQPEGGSVTASRTGSVPAGSVIYLNNEPETGWAFRYYTMNGTALTGAYATVRTNAQLSAVFEAVVAGVLNISYNPYCDVSVVKTGLVEQEGELVTVTDYPVASGDPLYEDDELKVTATLHEGAVPENEDLIFSAAAGMNNPYTYTYTYAGSDTDPVTRVANTFTVDSTISGEGVTLVLDITPLTTQKLWRYQGDTSWYSDSETVFTLTNARQLAGLQVLVLSGKDFAGKTVRLGADISLANDDGTNGRRFWDGIGNANYKFAGCFDGAGYKITDYHGNMFGLFGYVEGTMSRHAEIRSVRLYGDVTGAAACGIAGYAAYTTITGCQVYCVIEGTSSYTGGILGQDQAGCIIENCANYGSVTGVGQVGGIAGQLSTTGTVTYCVNKGSVTVAKTGNYNAGGLIGSLSGVVSLSANTGNVTSAGRNCGGIAGSSSATAARIENCYNAGSVTYDGGNNTLDSLGGIVGFGAYYQIKNSFNYGAVTKVSGSLAANIGGVIGRDMKRSDNTTENVFYNSDVSAYAVMSTSADDLGTVTYWQGISAADTADFANASAVLASINDDAAFVLTNGLYPELAFESGALHVHTGGTATCMTLAVCETCGLSYGELDPENHEEPRLTGRREAAWNVNGTTGDLICGACGVTIEAGEVLPADTTLHAFTVNVVSGDETILTKDYTIAEFDALKSSEPIVYTFGNNMMVSDWYVTIADLMEDVGVTEAQMISLVVTGSSGLQSFVSKETYQTCNKYYDPEGEEHAAPAAVAINWNSGSGSVETLIADSVVTGALRFGYGISEAQKDDPNVGGNRLISPVDTLTITVEESGADVTGGITGYIGTGTVSVTLSQEGGETLTASVTDNTSYAFTGVDNGTYTLTVSADGDYVDHEYEVTVEGEATELDVCIYERGDVNMDSFRRAGDVTALGRHLAKIAVITDPYALLLADTNHDGAVNSQDVTHLGQYLAKLIPAL